MIDAITHAKMEGRPLMILFTDFPTAFNSIIFNHIENSLRFMEFPDNFIWAFMKLVNNGTLQVEVNNSKSAIRSSLAQARGIRSQATHLTAV